jgi:hypothetical protein
MTFALIWPRTPGGYLFQSLVHVWLIDLYYHSRSLLDFVAFIIYDGKTFKTASASPPSKKKRQFQYVCCITTDSDTKHTKWQIMYVGTVVMHNGRGTNLMQCVFMRVCVCATQTQPQYMYIYTAYMGPVSKDLFVCPAKPVRFHYGLTILTGKHYSNRVCSAVNEKQC